MILGHIGESWHDFVTIRDYDPAVERVGGQATGMTLVRKTETPGIGAPAEDEHIASPLGRAATQQEARVAELRRNYQEGTYKVDSEELSAQIVDRYLDRPLES